MACEHKHIKSVNCVLYCMDCGAKLDAIPVKPEKPAEEKPKRRPKKGAEK